MNNNSRSKASSKYNREKTISFTIRLNKKTDADIITALESVTNRNALIKKLLRQEIEKGFDND